MKFLLKIFFTSLLFYSLIFPKGYIYRWKSIPVPTNNETTFMSGNSAKDFYLKDKFGNLFHYNNGSWKKYSVPDQEYAQYIWEKIGEEKFLVACWDTEWKSHFYILQNGKWRKLKHVNPTPVHHITLTENNIYIYGNFGTFLKLVGDNLEPIKSDIKNHINFFQYFSPNRIYIAVKAEGLYKFDGSNFTHIPFPNNSYNEIRTIYKTPDEKLQVIDFHQRIYQLDGDSLKRIVQKNVVYKDPEKENFGFRQLNYKSGDSLITVSFPNSMQLRSYKIFGDTILVTTKNGKLYSGIKSKSNYFINMAADYNIPGILYITPIGTIFLNSDSDLNLDIFSLYNSKNYSSRLYKNINDSPFLDVSSSANLSAVKNSIKFHFADFDGDGVPDLVTVNTDSVSNWLNIFLNKNGFRLQTRIDLNNIMRVRTPRNIKAIDYDKDGDLDIELVYYYGEGPKSGKVFFLENKFWGSVFEPDTSFIKSSKGWNISSLFADFNNDDENDIYLITMWRLNKFFIGKNGKFTNETEKRFTPLPRLDAKKGRAIDYDNDGDLDIFILTNNLKLIIYDNDGNGFFTKSNIPVELDSSRFFYDIFQSLNCGDFNNDGFTDIFISYSGPNKSENIILMNDSAKQFIDKTESLNVKTPFVLNTSVGDIDNDGDLDILGSKYGKSLLWINTLNDENYLELILHGSKSNSTGLHAKIYIYSEGGLNNPSKLIAYKQNGSDDAAINSQNSPVLHFGLDSRKKYDIKIKFYGGEEKILTSVSTGQIININEREKLATFLGTIPRLFYQTVTSKTIRIYFFLVLLGFLLIYLEIVFAANKFKWNVLLTSILAASNISLYYLILFLTASADTVFMKYVLPVLVLIATLIFSNLVFMLIKKYQLFSGKNTEEYWEDLLTQIMQFTHGEWALKNLNSLHLFCSNPLDNYDELYLTQFENRKKTFLEFTAPAINQILLIHSKINDENKSIEIIATAHESILKMLKNLQTLTAEKNELLLQISTEIEILIKALSDFRKEIFGKFSSDVNATAENIKKIFLQSDESKEIEIVLINRLNDKIHALIKSYELADILDNAVKNSIKALKKNSGKKKIQLMLYHNVPHICIDIIDNGCGIEKEKWEVIFEQGYTESKGTGFGLNFSQKILNKYGGRIFVKESEINEGTIFTIEMIEGVANA